MMKRRTFLNASGLAATGVAIGSAVPGIWMQSLASELRDSSAHNDRILVVIQFSGGNDGLNTIVPYNNDLYIKARPNLRIAKSDVVTINEELGLHPSLRSSNSLLEANRFAIVQGVGYENPNRSHFESMDIWHTCARRETRTKSGWLGRMFAQNVNPEQLDAPGLHLGSEAFPLALVERGVQIPSMASIEQLRLKNHGDGQDMVNLGRDGQSTTSLGRDAQDTGNEADDDLLGFVSASTEAAMVASRRLEKAVASPDESADFPTSDLGEKLKIVSRLILAGLKTQVYYLTLDGFDTHSNQLGAHSALLRQWSDAIAAFHQRLERDGQQDRVLVMTFSEFGRRVAENASAGTDHGAAGPMFFSGPKMTQSIVGALPSLEKLDDGDLKFHTDFRSIYATAIENWLGIPSRSILNGEYKTVDLFAS